MVGGWIIGNFDPSLLKTNDVEVAIKRYKDILLKRYFSLKIL
jgi:hypothetical protein